MNLHEWRCVADQGYSYGTYRMKVPGGWLYRYGSTADSSIIFVPEAAE